MRAFYAGPRKLILAAKGKGLEIYSPNCKLIVVGPPGVKIGDDPQYHELLASAIEKRDALIPLYRSLAEKHGAGFLDLSSIYPDPVDGVHLTPESHQKIAKLMAEKIRSVTT